MIPSAAIPPQAIQPLRDRVAVMRAQDAPAEKIAELEALIKQLESGNVPRHS